MIPSTWRRQVPQRIRGLTTAWVATLVIGLIFIAVGAEGLAAFNACLADPACLPDASAMNVDAFFAILAAGIGIVTPSVLLLPGREGAAA